MNRFQNNNKQNYVNALSKYFQYSTIFQIEFEYFLNKKQSEKIKVAPKQTYNNSVITSILLEGVIDTTAPYRRVWWKFEICCLKYLHKMWIITSHTHYQTRLLEYTHQKTTKFGIKKNYSSFFLWEYFFFCKIFWNIFQVKCLKNTFRNQSEILLEKHPEIYLKMY